jgi:DNA transposition AAA+ family ATPase
MQHWGDLPGARAIETRDLKRVGETIDTTVADAGIGLIIGDPGLGKTFACTWHLQKVERTVLSPQLPYHPPPRALTGLLYGDLIGETDPRGTRMRLQWLFTDALTRGHWLVHLDEAQNLHGSGYRVIRNIYDRVPGLPLVLSGGPELEASLADEPMLRSRVVAQHRLAPLTVEDVLEALPRFHAIYKGADLALLVQVNDAYARGNFRNWAIFTKQAARECQRQSKRQLTEDVVKQVLPGLPPPLTEPPSRAPRPGRARRARKNGADHG